jgi:diphthine synthase
MSIPTAVQQLVDTEQKRNEGILRPDTTLAIAVSRVGGVPTTTPPMASSTNAPLAASTVDQNSDDDEDSPQYASDTHIGPLPYAQGQTLVAGTLADLLAQPPATFGAPLHSLVLVGRRLHPLEVEYAEAFAVNKARWREVATNVYGVQLE